MPGFVSANANKRRTSGFCQLKTRRYLTGHYVEWT